MEASSLTALLGPTNTGKTHRAVERMLEHDSGMIGLPLRLLAREVYDKVTARVGEERVALVTGEEKRIPNRPDYWVCTVEAMPVDRVVDFVAIDEIQMATSEQRGHVFTARILEARGRVETCFLGAETMREALSQLVPTAKIQTHPRLSKLSFAGTSALQKLPPRSAVVGFSIAQVYHLAERLRIARGGAAVVMGALSPRTRNAQVAMFQAGEVDHLVATDAIGMGLNLDVRHVAFASLRKFDGRELRDVDEAELGQIAGRAGRHLQDGTFGTVAPLDLPMGLVSAIEMHRFPRVRRVRWRNTALEFTTIETLQQSLRKPPPLRILLPTHNAEDQMALERLSQLPSVRERLGDATAVRLLWNVCTVPDFRKLLFEAHVSFLEELFCELYDHGVLRASWIAPRIQELNTSDGDVETLLARIAAVRIWTYVSHQARWLSDASHWQTVTRELEDRLSDALHERLMSRFVDERAPARAPTSSARKQPHSPRKPTPVDVEPGHPFAPLRALRDALAPAHTKSIKESAPSWVESILQAPHERFALSPEGRITDGTTLLGRLIAGQGLLLPEIRLAHLEGVGAGARTQLQRRLLAYTRDVVDSLLSTLRSWPAAERSAPVRGLFYQLEQSLGSVSVLEVQPLLTALSPEELTRLQSIGVTVGRLHVVLPKVLKPAAIQSRIALAGVYYGLPQGFRSPSSGAVTLVPVRSAPSRWWQCIGYPVFGPRAVRLDVVERVADELLNPQSEHPMRLFNSWLGCGSNEVALVVQAIEESLDKLGLQAQTADPPKAT